MKATLVFLLSAFYLSSSAQAERITLLEITNDQDNRAYTMSLETDSANNILKFFQTPKANQNELESEFNMDDLRKGDVVLSEEEGTKLIALSLIDEQAQSSYQIRLDYLYNGTPFATSWERNYIAVELVNDEWGLYRHGKKIKGMHLIAHLVTFLGVSQPVGIERIDYTYED